MPMKCSSLRTRVLVTTTLVCLLVWGGWAAWQTQRMWRPDSGYWDEGLLGFTAYVMGSLPAGVVELPPLTQVPSAREGHEQGKANVFQVWRRDAALVIASPGAPSQPLTPIGSDATRRFSTQVYGGQRWRVLVMTHDSGEFEVHSAKPELAMRNDLTKAALAALPTALVLLAALLAGLWFALGVALAGVGGVRRAIERRSEWDLTPIPLEPLPQEVRPIIAAFNQMLLRLHTALANEKRFISNAAHELRTPLAALRAQAQVAQRISSEPAVNESLAKLTAIIDRASRLAHQLLTFARFEAAGAAAREDTLALATLTLDVAHEFGELARQRGLHLRVQAAPSLVRGDPEQIGALLRNLIDNAVRYTPAGGTVLVECRAADDIVTLSVADSGPGIPSAEQALVFDRFYRGQGTQAQVSGSGLGLAIVREVVERHRGSVRLLGGLARGGGGLTVEVQLPSPVVFIET